MKTWKIERKNCEDHLCDRYDVCKEDDVDNDDDYKIVDGDDYKMSGMLTMTMITKWLVR